MISQSYNFKEFIDEVKDKSILEIIQLAEQEIYKAEKRSYGVHGAVRARKEGIVQYTAILKGFLFFMRSGIKPDGVDDWDFQLFSSVCSNLVKK